MRPFVATEMSRILTLDGHFSTQQVGHQRYQDFHHLLKLSPPYPAPSALDLSLAKAQVEAAGLRVLGSDGGERTMSLTDVGAFAWYLKAIPWEVQGFSIQTFRNHLEELHSRIQRSRPLQVRQSGFWLEEGKANSA